MYLVISFIFLIFLYDPAYYTDLLSAISSVIFVSNFFGTINYFMIATLLLYYILGAYLLKSNFIFFILF